MVCQECRIAFGSPSFFVTMNVSVSAMLVDTRQKKYRSSFYS